MQALILAGGKGTRLHPYTLAFPKPMLPVGGVPIIETIVRQLAHYGFTDIVISLGYLGEYIRMFFNEGSRTPAGCTIRFFTEDEPLGTAGPIALMENHDEDFLVINGDVLTTVDYSKLMATHREKNPTLTVSVVRKEVNISLGVLELDEGSFVTKFTEKPTYHFNDNMGIYICNRSILRHIPKNQRLDMNILVDRLIGQSEPVYGYRVDDAYYWIDVGRHGDYEQANEEFDARIDQFLPDGGGKQ